jgi:hypothetical protein
MKTQTRVNKNPEKKENKTERSPAKKRSEKIETKREDPQYDEDYTANGGSVRSSLETWTVWKCPSLSLSIPDFDLGLSGERWFILSEKSNVLLNVLYSTAIFKSPGGKEN